jgi:hypothetical protein
VMVYNVAFLINIFWSEIRYNVRLNGICSVTSYLTVVRFVHV